MQVVQVVQVVQVMQVVQVVQVVQDKRLAGPKTCKTIEDE